MSSLAGVKDRNPSQHLVWHDQLLEIAKATRRPMDDRSCSLSGWTMTPKVFISYSWSSEGHKERVRQWAERLTGDGVHVVLDIYDLKEGHDKYVFMERMVTDATITHVLVVSDRTYANKADSREAGVGTETQIISREVYEKVAQSKFIPLVCEFDAAGEPCLPAFLSSRIWVNFSTPEATNGNWERLIRVLFGQPEFERPALGKPPAYLTEKPSSGAASIQSKLAILKHAALQGKPGIALYREDFIGALFSQADAMRVRQQPDAAQHAVQVLSDCGGLRALRNLIVDWLLLEASVVSHPSLSEVLHDVLERLLSLRGRPAEVTTWNESWFAAHSFFVYETFLYIVAALIKVRAYEVLRDIFENGYLVPPHLRSGSTSHESFVGFHGSADVLQQELAAPGKRLFSPAGELVKRQADRSDLPLADVLQAELLVLLMAFVTPSGWWYPGTLFYASYNTDFPLFARATRSKNFAPIRTIANVTDGNDLRNRVRDNGHNARLNKAPDVFTGMHRSYTELMHLEELDTQR